MLDSTPRFLANFYLYSLKSSLLCDMSLCQFSPVLPNCPILFCCPIHSTISVFGEGSFSLLVYREMEMIAPSGDLKTGTERVWGVQKEEQIPKQKLEVLDSLAGVANI